MNLEDLKAKRERALTFKNIAPKWELLKELPNIDNLNVNISDTIEIDAKIDREQSEFIKKVALELRPWRKGPFKLFNIFIDSEWRSYIKYNLLEPHFDLKDKRVADIGCNNGYYLFRMLKQKPKKLIGFDPSALCRVQFDFINHFLKSDIEFEMLGVEDLPIYREKFDFIFSLGVLYHRSDPIGMLKDISQALTKDGEFILDTFMIDGDEEVALTPELRYSKIPNIYFIPTIPALKNWLKRAKFKDIEILAIKSTDLNEQRETEWILGESLNQFLDSEDSSKTIEGYPAPKRVYIKCRRQ